MRARSISEHSDSVGDSRTGLRARVRAAGGWYAWANSALIRVAGPATLGPYETEPPPSRETRPCPLCGAEMRLHSFDRTGPKPLMTCPEPSTGA